MALIASVVVTWHCDHVKRSSLTSVCLANPVHGGKPRLDDVIPNLATKWGVGERGRIERGRTKRGKREREMMMKVGRED